MDKKKQKIVFEYDNLTCQTKEALAWVIYHYDHNIDIPGYIPQKDDATFKMK